jgi:hypothetical protein
LAGLFPKSQSETASIVKKKYAKWIVLTLILFYAIGIEIYRGGEKLPWTLIFCAVVVCFLYSFWKKK